MRADDDARRNAIGLDVDDSGWAEVQVPGHWRHHPDFADNDDPVLYRHRFSMAKPDEGRRRWITLDGIFYQADVFLDGAYLGDPEGYFFPHSFDVTALSSRIERRARRGDRGRLQPTGELGYRGTAQRSPAIFQHWDGIDRDWNPGGLWRSVHSCTTPGPYADRPPARVVCRDADEARAHVLLQRRGSTVTTRRGRS